jgi:signal transduction histidine kinase
VKFTPRGKVVVTVAAEPAAGGRVAIGYEVRDSGPGLDPASLAHLFDAFTQADGSATRSHGGVGVGLALCRRLAEAMGGSVSADSAPGEGARFRIRTRTACPTRRRERAGGRRPQSLGWIMSCGRTTRSKVAPSQ